MNHARSRCLSLVVASALLAGCLVEGDFFGGEFGETIESPEGLWNGAATFVGGGGLFAMVKDGEFVIVQTNGDVRTGFYSGEYDPAGDGPWPGTLEIYDGDGRLEQAINTTLAPTATLNLQAGGDREVMALNYLPDAYEAPSGLDLASGVWDFQENLPGLQITLTVNIDVIDGNGTLFGSDTEGCIYLGNVEVLDPERNVYRISNLELSEQGGAGIGCDRTDDVGAPVSFASDGYNGLAAYFPGPPDAFWMIVSNGERAMFRDFTRVAGEPDDAGDEDEEE
jgi:hypothetical protein